MSDLLFMNETYKNDILYMVLVVLYVKLASVLKKM